MVYGEPDQRARINKTLATCIRADKRQRRAADLAARVPSPAGHGAGLSFNQVKAMLRERLSSLLLQVWDRPRVLVY